MSSMSPKTNKTNKANNKNSVKIKKLSKIFDADYYENGIPSKKSNYKDYSWPRLKTYFDRTAQHIKNNFSNNSSNPSTLLDVGCAKGFLVFSLRNLGVNAIGIDASEYAISSAPKEVNDFVGVGLAEEVDFLKQFKDSMINDFKENGFDIVTALDVMEHLDEKDVPQVCKNLLHATSQYVIVCVPTRKVEGDLDVTHKTIRPREWWEERFMEAGGDVGVKVNIEPIDKYVDKNVWWFNIPEFLIVVKKEPRGL